MTEENTMTQNTYGENLGQVLRFFNRKGYGFIRDLDSDTDLFVHNTEIMVADGGYRKLYPGEYVSFTVATRDEREVCSNVRGVRGGTLLTENEDHVYRVFPRQNRMYEERETPDLTSVGVEELIISE